MLFICLRRANCNGHGAQSLDKVQLAWLPRDVVIHGWNVCCVRCQEKVRQRHLAIKHDAMARLWTTAQETTRDHFTQVAVPLDSVRVLSYFFYFFLFSLNFLWEQHHPHWLKFNFLREPHTWISSAEESASTVNTSRPNCIDWTQPRPSSSRIFWAWVGWIHFSAISSSLNPCLKCD